MNGIVVNEIHSSFACRRDLMRGKGMRRDTAAMLYWALRWHEGRRVSCGVLGDVLWGEFAYKPKDPAPSLRELMVYVRKRHGDKWTIEDCGRAYRISPRVHASKVGAKSSKGTSKGTQTRAPPLSG